MYMKEENLLEVLATKVQRFQQNKSLLLHDQQI